MADLNNPQTAKRLAEGKSLGGRPPMWDSAEKMEAAIEVYFTDSVKYPKKTVCGLALMLGFCDIHDFMDYATKDEFAPVVARARLRAMEAYEQCGLDPRSSHFPDRMLTRLKWPCVEAVQQSVDPEMAELLRELNGVRILPGTAAAAPAPAESGESPVAAPAPVLDR